MDISVTGRHITVSDRFRERLEAKLSKVGQLDPRVHRIDVVVTRQPERRGGKECERVEVTCYGKGPVVRAEACMEDMFVALDVVMDKLLERFRRAGDRRKVHRGRRTPESVAHATARIAETPLEPGAPDEGPPEQGRFGAVGDSPIEVREKVHTSPAMTLEQALREMELVGHDFYLFQDVESGRPSVVYRRRGWSYGVLHLEVTEDGAAPGEAHTAVAS